MLKRSAKNDESASDVCSTLRQDEERKSRKGQAQPHQNGSPGKRVKKRYSVNIFNKKKEVEGASALNKYKSSTNEREVDDLRKRSPSSGAYQTADSNEHNPQFEPAEQDEMRVKRSNTNQTTKQPPGKPSELMLDDSFDVNLDNLASDRISNFEPNTTRNVVTGSRLIDFASAQTRHEDWVTGSSSPTKNAATSKHHR